MSVYLLACRIGLRLCTVQVVMPSPHCFIDFPIFFWSLTCLTCPHSLFVLILLTQLAYYGLPLCLTQAYKGPGAMLVSAVCLYA